MGHWPRKKWRKLYAATIWSKTNFRNDYAEFITAFRAKACGSPEHAEEWARKQALLSLLSLVPDYARKALVMAVIRLIFAA